MSSKQYLKNQLHVILLNILGVLALALFLIAIGTSIHAISLIALVWIVVVLCYLTILYFNCKRHLNELLAMIDQLEEKYLLPEVEDAATQYLLFTLIGLLFFICCFIYLAGHLIVVWKEKSPKYRYKGENLFLFGQIISKLNTTSKTMTLICVTFVLAIFLFIAAPILVG